jgi:hypothetical protein
VGLGSSAERSAVADVPRRGLYAAVPSEPTDTAVRLARAAAALGREGIRVEHRRTTFLADDETSFYLVGAPSPTAVSELCRRAGLEGVRIVRAIET